MNNVIDVSNLQHLMSAIKSKLDRKSNLDHLHGNMVNISRIITLEDVETMNIEELEKTLLLFSTVIDEFYVDGANGSDLSGDGSEGRPWKTIQHSIDSMKKLCSPIGRISLYIANGIYVENVEIESMNINVIGNDVTPNAVTIKSLSGRTFQALGGDLYISGIRFEGSTLRTFLGAWNNHSRIANCVFYSNVVNEYDVSSESSFVRLYDVNFAGPLRGSILGASYHGVIWPWNNNKVIDPTTVTNLVHSYHMGNVIVSGATSFTSSVTITGRRYQVTQMGRLETLSNLPAATIAGTTATGGTVI